MRNSGCNLGGVWVAMVTPWNARKRKPKTENLPDLVSYFIRAEVHGLFILGTTGEGALLPPQQRKEFTEQVLETVQDRVPVIVHVGHDRTDVAQDLAAHAHRVGAAAVAVSAPARYPLNDSELEEHFVAVGGALSDLPFLLYDIPSSTGNPLCADLLLRVGDRCQNLQGIKVSRDEWPIWEDYLKLKSKKKLTLLVGADALCYALLSEGASGVVSGLANAMPRVYVELHRAVQERDMVRALIFQGFIDQLRSISNNGSLPMIKSAMESVAVDVGPLVAPLQALSPKQEQRLGRQLQDLLVDFNAVLSQRF